MNNEYLHAKLVVLGDNRTGKSSLINRLCVNNSLGSNDEPSTLFSTIQFQPNETEHSGPVALNTWEYDSTRGNMSDDVALTGALICIITVDLRYPQTADNAFNHWIALKDQYMPSSFTFIVGTHLDQPTERCVDINEICKACSQNDAVYLEVSNYDFTNIELLRRLLAQRIKIMLNFRNSLKSNVQTTVKTSSRIAQIPKYKADQDIVINSADNFDITEMEMPAFNNQIIPSSVETILASSLYCDIWPGYVNEQHDVTHLGDQILAYVQNFEHENKIGSKDMNFEFKETNFLPLMSERAVEDFYSDLMPVPEPSELKEIFSMLGFNMPEENLSALLEVNSQMSNARTSSMSCVGVSGVQSSAASLCQTLIPGLSAASAAVRSSPSHSHSARLTMQPFSSPSSINNNNHIIPPPPPPPSGVSTTARRQGNDAHSQLTTTVTDRVQSSASSSSSSSSWQSPGVPGPRSTSTVGAEAETGPVQRLSLSIRVKLPDGTSSTLHIKPSSTLSSSTTTTRHQSHGPQGDVQEQVLQFAQQHNMTHDHAAVTKLIQAAHAAVQQQQQQSQASRRAAPNAAAAMPSSSSPVVAAATASSSPGKSINTAARNGNLVSSFSTGNRQASSSSSSSYTHATGAPLRATKKCKLRIQLPTGATVDILLHEGQDLNSVTSELSAQHALPSAAHSKILSQLRKAFNL